MTKIQIQFSKIEAYLKRIEALYKGIKVSYEPINTYQDDINSFFTHCYHMKDYIEHDKTVSTKEKPIEYVKNSKCLSIARDICTVEKHCTPTTEYFSKQKPKIDAIMPSTCVGGEYDYKIKMSFDTSLGQMDALDLARKCMDDWIAYFEKENIEYLPKSKNE